MGSEWKNIPLGDLITLQRGHDLPSQDREDGDVPIMGSSGLTGYHSQAKCEGPGVVVGRSGNSMGVVSFCEVDYWPLNTALYITDFKGNDPRYIYYLLSLIDFDKFDSGSAQKSLNRNAVYPYEVWATDNKDEQKSIGQLLEAYEKKIALNRQINTTLESMAQALFKSWFVDFDPVIDNALAAGNEIPDALQKRAAARREALHQQTNKTTGAKGASGSEQALLNGRLPAEIQQLFPDRFVFTEEMGWVPEGWEVKKLGDFAEKISKGTTPSKAVLEQATGDNSIPFIKVKDLDDFGDIKLDSLEMIPDSVHAGALKRSILKVNDVLFSIAGTIGRVAIVPSHLHNSNTNQAVAFVRPEKQSMGAYITMLLRSEQIQGLVNSRIVQAVQANFSLTELAGIPVLDAGTPIFDQWHEQSKAWFSAIALNRDSSVCLSNLRDSLLPKLLSGQITISDAEQQLAEVL
ncbi:type I restriction-modification system subunit S [Bacterioplanes sanyensis]|uniref:restriction endonuclease subunit S n=1 Tax=Bacterioplanes sanyensis TaxID=1249553 RepID=UPI00167BE505|nr:restriction endonuclease subunit S [Bacterioplanes sanyensis]GGY44211.1 type I restriction-modification system subunit S [Bacterioplanes sanyensis]